MDRIFLFRRRKLRNSLFVAIGSLERVQSDSLPSILQFDKTLPTQKGCKRCVPVYVSDDMKSRLKANLVKERDNTCGVIRIIT